SLILPFRLSNQAENPIFLQEKTLMKNLIKTQFTQAERETIGNLMEQLETAVAGKLTALTEEERIRYGSVNEQNKLLVNKTRDYRQNQPALSSPDVDWTEFESDYESRAFLESIAQRLSSVAYQMQSTKILHDHDNYQDSLSDYSYAQYKKGAGEAGYTEKVAEMKQFFNRTGTTNTPPPENPS
ncbi:MAG TPA: hypothetical protein PKE69_15045, partial [Pyrinomonadaceae bacterium]|nr:hypothetical protein [Pyrinomonadaceae bacterium]